MTDLQQLIAARDLLSDPRRWTTETFARNAEGDSVSEYSADACSFCAHGAINHVAGGHFGTPTALYTAAARLLKEGEPNVAEVNDHLGYAATMKMFALAIDIESGKVDSCDAN